MPTFPIPAAYITTGAGPGQIPVRDSNGTVPGVPIIYNRTLSDEVAAVLREQIGSGFLRGGEVLGTLDVTPFAPNRIYLDGTAKGGIEVVVNGYRLSLGSEMIAVELNPGPIAGTRDDLLFLEAWFARGDKGTRTLQWRLRLVDGVNFTLYPEGLGDPSISAHNNKDDDLGVAYQKHNPVLDTDRDAGLYTAVVPAAANDALADKGTDGNLYYIYYALPVARLKRLNRTEFDIASNPNGASIYDPAGVSLRPDGLWSNAINVDYQIVDLRHVVSLKEDRGRRFRESVVKQLTNQLSANGRKKLVLSQLDQQGQLSYLGDLAKTEDLTLAVNLVKYSHFRVGDAGDAKLATGWTAYNQNTEGVTGGYVKLAPAGQTFNRTAPAPDDAFGMTQALSGFLSKTFAVRFKYKTNSTNDMTQLIVEGRRADNSTAFSITRNLISDVVGVENEAKHIFVNDRYDQNLTLYVILRGGAGDVTMYYVDVKTDERFTAPMEITDRTSIPVIRSNALAGVGATLNVSATQVLNALTGSPVSHTATVVNADLVTFNFASAPTQDLRLMLKVDYVAGSGFPELIDNVTRAWDGTGFIGLVKASSLSDTMAPMALGTNLNLVAGQNESVTAYNPSVALRGVTATLRMTGNGTGTYTIAPSAYGRKVLLPLDLRVEGTSRTLSSVVRNDNGSLTVTLADSGTIPQGSIFEVDVALDAPLIVWDRRENGIIQLVRSLAVETVATSAVRTVHIPVPGKFTSRLNSSAVANVFVNGAAVQGSAITSVLGANTSMVSITMVDPLTVNDVVECMVLVQQEVYEESNINVAYSTGIQPTVEGLADEDEVEILSDPYLLVHTKGTAGQDLDGDFGPSPFVRDARLTSAHLKLTGQVEGKSTLMGLSVLQNTAQGLPLYTGRKITYSDLAGLVLEGMPLSGALPHRVVATALVAIKGRQYLMVFDKYRTDSLSKVDGVAPLFYELDGRPLIIQEV